MRPIYFLSLILLSSCATLPKSEPYQAIKIARDQWGVPHIMAKTDAQVAYGLAWAQCEDDFHTMQEQMAAVKGMLGEIKGKKGIIADFGIQFMGLQETVWKHYDQDVKGDFKKYLDSYVAGANAYAKLHPKEVLHKRLFPLTGRDILAGYLLGNVEVSGAGKDLVRILEGKIAKEFNGEVPKGSNAIAISNKKTTDGKTYLAINSHQPLEGWYSWYEAHLISEEGLNILGGTFPGGICIFHGTNENLGWAHTVNHADFSDVYKLTMHPEKELYYQFNRGYLPLKKKEYRAKLKVAGIFKIPIKRVIYESEHGPVFKTKDGFYAWRFVVGQDIRMAEQWYEMNKASNFDEFYKALEIRGLASLNIVYADRKDNIYYLSNGRLPLRNPKFNWKGVLRGNTSINIWRKDLAVPLDSLPQVFNPACGWVFNTNNTPFSASSKQDNPIETSLNKTMGFQSKGLENNRSLRFLELIKQYDKLSYEDFKSIKYDQEYPNDMTIPDAPNLELIFQIDPQKYPDLQDVIQLLIDWDRRSDIKNRTAPLFITTWNHINAKRKTEDRIFRGSRLTEDDCVYGLRAAKKELLENFGVLDIPLGKFQRHIRGKVNLPLGGAPDVLAAMYSKKQKDGTYKGMAGESYIQLVRFGEKGVEIESVNAYGASAKDNSSHFTDQMDLFATQKLKTMTLDKTTVLENAIRVYSPLKIQ